MIEIDGKNYVLKYNISRIEMIENSTGKSVNGSQFSPHMPRGSMSATGRPPVPYPLICFRILNAATSPKTGNLNRNTLSHLHFRGRVIILAPRNPMEQER